MSRFWSKMFSVLCALCILCRAFPADAELPREIRVITYNIHHGEGTDSQIDLERIAKVLNAESPHLVAVNEVDQGTRRTHGIDMPAELARLTGMKAVFEKNIDHDGGLYGNAVLSRLPIRRHNNHKLPSHYQGEQRGVLEVELGDEDAPKDQTVLFLATHLDYREDDHERLASAEKFKEIVGDRQDQPVILAGDLNATPDSRVLAAFARHWKRTAGDELLTFPSSKPEKQIDYILVRPADKWEVLETRVLKAPVESDHLPVLAVLRRRP